MVVVLVVAFLPLFAALLLLLLLPSASCWPASGPLGVRVCVCVRPPCCRGGGKGGRGVGIEGGVGELGEILPQKLQRRKKRGGGKGPV